LEKLANTRPIPDPTDANFLESTMPPVLRPYTKPVDHHDIYMDDYISQIQGRLSSIAQSQRRLLYSIDDVFRPLDSEDSAERTDIPSRKKMLKGDAYPTTQKSILGWIIDTVRGTLELPPHRVTKVEEIFAYLHGRTRVSIKRWHQILGELRSLAIGIPGCRGLFGALQHGLRHTDKQRINLNKDIRNALHDFKWLADDLSSRPTSIAELVPDHPIAIGPHDASGFAMGGCWLPAVNGSTITRILWCCRFPPEVTATLITDANPQGTITNSDLELAGQIAQLDVFAQNFQCAGRTIVPLGDNIPSVSWSHKGSITTLGPTGYLL
jgi:hypothetical protein